MNLAVLANRFWWTANLPHTHRFEQALSQPRRAQETLLRGYLRDNADTAFGRMHGFRQISTVEQYRTQVPIRRYDDFRPYIDRICSGESGVLTRQPVRALVPSSGSTAAVKLVPYTDTLQREFARAIGPWMVDLFRHDPGLAGGPAYWSISPVVWQDAEHSSVVPIGFDEDSAYLGCWGKKLVDAALAVPGAVRLIGNIDSYRYVTQLYLLRARSLRLISVWHPSFLGLLMQPLVEHWQGLLRDLADGLVRPPKPLPSGLAQALRIPRNRERVRELERLGPSELSRLWPELRLISCWADAHAASYVPTLQRLFPGVTIQPKGLIATEGFISLPYCGDFPLAVGTHFFEFIDDGGQACLASEVEEGGEYRVVLTIGGGLYRYDLGDRVRVTGWLRKTPCIAFVGKDDAVSDLCGEKLSDGFVGQVLGVLFNDIGLAPTFSLLAPEQDDESLPRYVLYLETAEALPSGLAETLERRLRANPHYDYCVRLGQLGSCAVVRTVSHAYQAYVERCHQLGQRPGSIKPSPLSRCGGWKHILASHTGL